MEHKRAARTHRGTDRLSHAAPAAVELLKAAAARGPNLGTVTEGACTRWPRVVQRCREAD
jgi:hypothetical protein